MRREPNLRPPRCRPRPTLWAVFDVSTGRLLEGPYAGTEMVLLRDELKTDHPDGAITEVCPEHRGMLGYCPGCGEEL